MKEEVNRAYKVNGGKIITSYAVLWWKKKYFVLLYKIRHRNRRPQSRRAMSHGGGHAHRGKGAQNQKLSLQAVSGIGYSIQQANIVCFNEEQAVLMKISPKWFCPTAVVLCFLISYLLGMCLQCLLYLVVTGMLR